LAFDDRAELVADGIYGWRGRRRTKRWPCSRWVRIFTRASCGSTRVRRAQARTNRTNSPTRNSGR